MQGVHSVAGMMSTLAKRSQGTAVRVGPSQIAAPKSPLGKQPASSGDRRIVLAQIDPRDRALMGAIWSLIYWMEFARQGAQSISLFDLTGRSGLIDLLDSSRKASPAFHVLAKLNPIQQIQTCLVKANDLIHACMWTTEDESGAWLVNSSPDSVWVDLSLLGSIQGCRTMDTQSVTEWIQTGEDARIWRQESLSVKRLELSAYTIVQLQLQPSERLRL